MNDELAGWEPEGNRIFNRGVKVFAVLLLLAVLLFVFLMVINSGCVSLAKKTYHNAVDTPTPTPTPKPPEPTPTPTPTPEPTPDYSGCGGSTCLHLRGWTFWFRPNANNFGEDLRTWVTVYDYKILPAFHYSAASTWGTTSRFRRSPDPGNEFLFIFINMYSDADDARQYLFGKNNFAVQVQDRLYYPDDTEDPTLRITELDNMWNYAHVQTPGPYGYKIKQDLHTGIYSAEEQTILYSGRSNASDGYLIYQIPVGSNISEIKVSGAFANLGGNVFWKLE